MLTAMGVVIFSMAFAAENKGAENMVLDGGRNGKVPFSHAVHQATLKDCAVCHRLFPQEPGIVETLKKEGKLKKRQVMKQCQTCHRETKKTGEKTGPTACKACHSG
jgi:hypothetical protein